MNILMILNVLEYTEDIIIPRTPRYCEDCKYRWNRFGSEIGKCSHIKNRQKPSYDRREEEEEMYPICTWVNEKGNCKLWTQKENFSFTKLVSFIWDTLLGRV